MRWAQLTLVEDDPGKYDPQFWLDYFRRTHSDAACLQRRRLRRLLSHEDPAALSQQVAGRHATPSANWWPAAASWMIVIARTDPHAVHQDVYDAHPDWIAVDAQGRKRKHWADAGAVGDVRAGALQFRVHDRSDQRDRARYKVDGIFSNRWAARACAIASTAKTNFKHFQRARLAAHQRIRRIRRGAHIIVWHQQRLFELWRLWDGEIRKINPERATSPMRAEARSATWT